MGLCFRSLGIKFLAQKKYFGVGSDLTNASGSFDSIQQWQFDFQQEQAELGRPGEKDPVGLLKE
jgi:hypothetical protein